MTRIDAADLAIKPIDQSSTLPAEWFIDPEIFALERELIFGRSWQLACRADQVSAPGAYATCEVAGEPMIVVRGRDSELRALSNVCRHKAARVTKGEGVRNSFQCSYHGWTYDLDGSLRAAPHFRGVTGFSVEETCLPQFRVGEWNPVVFVNLDTGARTLSEVLGQVPQDLSRYRLDDVVFSSQQTYEISCNWKVFTLNNVDCYHCPTIHPESWCKVASPDQAVVARDRDWITWAFELLNPPQSCRPGLDEWQRTHIRTVYLFPNTFVAMNPQFVIVAQVIPVGVDRTLYTRSCYVERANASDAERLMSSYGGLRWTTLDEDIAICEEVQKNLHSRHFRNGRLSVAREHTQHFLESKVREMFADGLNKQQSPRSVIRR